VSGSQTVYWGIRVWKRDAAGAETEITAGTPVAQVSRSSDGAGLQSNTWNCTQTTLTSTDSIVVRVYIKFGSGAWTLLGLASPYSVYSTEQIGASQLDAATWTVHYYTEREYDPDEDTTGGMFAWGDALFNSRIENFSWSLVVAAWAGDGLTWIQTP